MTETFAEEFIEGTMINVFYDMDIEKWQIATKSNIGAKVSFFDTSPSFAQMFREACVANNFQLDKLDKKYSYTFILQHPHNRIVMPIIYPTLYLLKVYKINIKTPWYKIPKDIQNIILYGDEGNSENNSQDDNTDGSFNSLNITTNITNV